MSATSADPQGAEAAAGPVEGSEASPYRSVAELRELLDALLERACASAAGGRHGPLGRQRLRIRDLELVVDVVCEAPEAGATWSFGEQAERRADLELSMTAAQANRYLQGAETLPLALARGHVAARAASGTGALQVLPLTLALVEEYRRMVADDYPHLALD